MTVDVGPEQQILEDVVALIREVVGEPWARDVDIDLDTSFSDDLEMESIEFVALAEKMQARYGRRVDFVAWLSDKSLEQIIDLTVGDVVELIARCR